jgi:uncharacterized protein (TIGR02996 family)
MTRADAFLQDILAHPDDDAPRLIFADWLEEQGDAGSVARADFIRVQCALASGELSLQQRAELDRQQQKLLEQYGSQWVRSIHRWVRAWEFHRGFIDTVAMSADSFFAHADRLFRRAPIQSLTLRPLTYPSLQLEVGPPPFILIAVLADNKHLRRLRVLGLSENHLESQHLRALVVSKHLTSLRKLDLSFNRIGDGGIRALSGAPLLGRLEHLNLYGNDIGANGLRALAHALEELARSSKGLRLQRLELSYDNLSIAGQRVIADSPLLRRLVRG